MSEEIHQTYISNMLHFTKTPHRTNFGNQQLHKRHLNGNPIGTTGMRQL